MTPAEEAELITALADQLRGSPGVVLRLDGQSAFTLATALQLACRHPSVSGDLREQLVEVVDHIAQGMGGAVAIAIASGWDPGQDR